MFNSIDGNLVDRQGAEGRPDVFRPDSSLAEEVLRAKGQYGRLTELARELDVDRRRLYDVRGRAEGALAAEFEVPDEELASPADTAVTEAPDDKVLFTLVVTVGLVKRVIVALRTVCPGSIRDIVAVLELIFGGAAAWSYGTVQSVLNEAGKQAREVMAKIGLQNVNCVVLDEMFSQRSPVLAGLDNDTQFLFLLEKRLSRTGEDWKEVLTELRDERGLNPERVVKDAGTGLARGVSDTWSDTEQRDDVFHALYDFGQAQHYLEQRALGVISKEYELEDCRERAKTESERRRLAQKLRHARRRTRRIVDRSDTFEKLACEAQELLKLAPTGSGVLYTPEEVQSGLERIGQAMMQVGGDHAHDAGRYLKNRAPGLALYLRALGKELVEQTVNAGGVALRDAATRLYQARLDAKRKSPSSREGKVAFAELRAAIEHIAILAAGSSTRVAQAMTAVFPVLDRRDRASSAVENFNSVLRPYLVVHKNVEQNFLDLFSFYWNTRQREWGRHKGTSAYSQLTGQAERDWLELLGYPRPTVVTQSLN